MNTCTCDKPTRDNAEVCDDCLDDFAKVLGDVTWLDAELDTTIAKLHAAGDAGSPSAEKPLPIHIEASNRRETLRHELVMLVRFCVEEGVRASDPSAGLPENTIVAMSRWLLWRVDGLAFNDMSAEFMASITAAVVACQRIIDLPPERAYAGPCSECKKDLYHRRGAAEVTCSECGSRFDVGELWAWMTSQVRDQLVTAQEGAALLCKFDLETAQDTIRKWRDRGLVVERGHKPIGEGRSVRMYAFGDLLDVAMRHGRMSA